MDYNLFACFLFFIVSSHYSPLLIVASYNPLIPPPISFRNDLSTNNGDYIDQDLPYIGCSLSAMNDIANIYGYQLLQVDLWKVLLLSLDDY